MSEAILRPCPHCAEKVEIHAAKCEHCGEFLEKPSETSSESLPASSYYRRQPVNVSHEAQTWLLGSVCASLIAVSLSYVVIAQHTPKTSSTPIIESNKSPVLDPIQQGAPGAVYRVNNILPAGQTPQSADAGMPADPSAQSYLINRLIQAAKNQDTAKIDNLIGQVEIQVKPVASDPAGATSLNARALAQLKNKNYSEAAKMFQIAAQKDPSDPKLFNNLGFAQMHLGDLSSAQKNLFYSLLLSPRRSVAWSDLGENFAKLDDREGAIACFMLGYKTSGGKTLGYLQSLAISQDEESNIVDAAKGALSRIPAIASH
jgi:tetratricopeptide (TPR) repeat protein